MNEKDNNGLQKLQSAEVNSLLKSGSDVNERNYSNSAPIHLAVQKGDLTILKTLSENGADLEAQDSEGNTALHLAVFNNDLKAVDYLISKGAKISPVDNNGVTPLQHSFNSNFIEIFEFLIKHQRSQIMPLLVDAVRSDKINMVKILLNIVEACMDTKAINELKMVLLYSAVKNNNIEMVKLLIVNKANFEACYADTWDFDFEGSLKLAIKNKNLEIIKILISHGPDVNFKHTMFANGSSLLHRAVSKSWNEIVQILIEIGVSLSLKNGDENKPIETALISDINVFKLICFMG